ncbi:MAG TPA: hypothetical protein VGX48_21280 [Pyrinomonadaceae bacterium]|jgi:hypothetical protein|nr:hypothetical protein [Pyrinomonadaceae bacterium]
MRRSFGSNLTVMLLALAALCAQAPAAAQKKSKKEPNATPVLWKDPGDVSARDLTYGPGSAELMPAPPFTFVEEDKGGESPKFEVRDSKGVRWSVKVGPEAQAETVATRLVWAVGYFAEEAYYFAEVKLENIPRLSRGREYVVGRTVRGARFEPRREGVKRGPTWGWHRNRFEESKELSGLKVLMILLNNYDAREANNRVIYADGEGGTREAHHYVTDLGATLGRAGGLGATRSKNSLTDFLSTKFVRGVDRNDNVVEFDYDTRPRGLGHFSVLHPFYYRGEVKKEKNMRGIPVEHAKWIGALLAQLTDAQLRSAFDAAGYEPATADGYVRALRDRINQLSQLDSMGEQK